MDIQNIYFVIADNPKAVNGSVDKFFVKCQVMELVICSGLDVGFAKNKTGHILEPGFDPPSIWRQ